MRGCRTNVVLTLATSCVLTMAALASSAHAAALYWNNAYSGGTWTDTGGTGWNTSGSGSTYNQAWGYGGNYDANFTGTAGTATVSGTISSVNSITFSTDGYTLSGGTINLTGTGGNITVSPDIINDVTNTISATLTGNVGLTKLGVAPLVVSGANTYSGGTTISAGTLNLGSPGAIGSSGTITFAGGTLQFSTSNAIDYSSRFSTAASQTYKIDTNGQSVTFASALIGSGSALVKSGSGTLTLSGTNKYSGPTTVSAGELDLNATGGNAIAGDLTVSGGTAKMLRSNQIASGRNLVVSNGGIFDLQGYNQTLGGGVCTLVNGSIIGSGSTLSSASGYNVYSGSISAILGGSGSLSKTTTGTVILSGANTYSGSTTVSAGELDMNTTGGNSIAGNLNVSNGSTVKLLQANQIASSKNLDVYKATFDLQGYNQTVASMSLTSGNVLGSGGTLTSTTDYKVRDGSISANLAGSVALQCYGTGTLTLSGVNTYTGGTAINGGLLDAMTAGALPGYDSSGSVSVASAATVAVRAGGWSSENIDTLMANAKFASGSGLGIDVTSLNSFTYGSAITGDKYFTKIGDGTLSLSGSNTYTGGTNINAGTLSLGSSGAIGSTGTITFGGGTLQFSVSNSTDYSSRFSTVSYQAYKIDTNGQSVTFATALTSSGSTLTKLGAGTLTLTGVNTFDFGITINAGELDLNATGGNAIAGSLTINGGTVKLLQSNQIASYLSVSGGTFDLQGFNQSVSSMQLTGGSIIGSGTLTSTYAYNVKSGSISANLGGSVALNLNGPGTVTLSGVNTYSGMTTVVAGELDLNTTGGNAIAGNLTVSNGGIVKLLQANQIASGKNLIVSSGTFNLQGYNQTFANVQLVSGNIIGSGGILTSAADYDVRFGLISAILGGSVGLNMTGNNTLTLSGANIYSGPTTITAGRIQLSGGSNRLPTTTSVTLANTIGAVLDLNGQNQTIASLSGGGTSGGNVTLGSGTLTLDSSLNGSPDTIYSGVISGIGGSLTKLGANMLTLSRVNTYTGTTTISSGTLALGVNNALPSASDVILGGGTLATGSFSQTNSLGELTLSSSSIIDMGVLGSSTLKFNDSHSTSWSGMLTITNWNGSFSGGGADELLFGSSNSTLTPGQLNEIIFTNPNGLSGDYQATILSTGEIIPVPEPAMFALLFSGGFLLGGLALRRWRRRILSA